MPLKLTPIDYDPFASQPLSYDAPVFAGDDPSNGATLGAYQPTLRERLRDFLMGQDKPSPERRRVAEGLTDIAGLTPLGVPMAAQEAKGDVNRGAYGSAALNAMAVLPMASVTANVGKKAVQAAAPAVERVLNEIGLFSHGAETAAALPQAKGTPEQFASMLAKAGVKGPELEGFNTAFAGRGSVDRDEVAGWFQGNLPQISERTLGKDINATTDINARRAELEDLGPNRTLAQQNELEDINEGNWAGSPYSRDVSNTKFSQYTLPGGENYRETLLKLPENKELPEGYTIEQQDNGFGQHRNINYFVRLPDGTTNAAAWRTPEAAIDNAMRRNMASFKSSHWDDPNVVAHLRMSDRTAGDEKVLHLEELQSDWGQQGRQKGFKSPTAQADYDTAVKALETKRGELQKQWPPFEGDVSKELEPFHNAVKAASENATNGVPSAPYVTNTTHWTDLGLKRALKEAADGGYDRLTWTPGAEQAKRYDLSKQISKIEYHDNTSGGVGKARMEGEPGPGNVVAYDKEGKKVIEKYVSDPQKELPDIVGKEVASKIFEQSPRQTNTSGLNMRTHTLAGQDLSVGGEGMKSYYDKIVPTRLKEIVKKLDPEAKIEPHEIDTRSAADKKMKLPAGQSANIIPTQSIRITPKMREAIKRGLPAFSVGGIGIGSVLSQDGKHTMTPVNGDPFKGQTYD